MNFRPPPGLGAILLYAALITGATVVAALLLVTGGCAHRPRDIVLPEPVGGALSLAISEATDNPPHAFWLPSVGTVYFSRTVADEPCAVRHQHAHEVDLMNRTAIPVAAEYGAQLVECLAGYRLTDEKRGAVDGCHRNTTFERRAWAAEELCRGEKP